MPQTNDLSLIMIVHVTRAARFKAAHAARILERFVFCKTESNLK